MLQSFSRFIENEFSTSLETQRIILLFVGVVIGVLLAEILGKDADFEIFFLYLAYILLVIFIWGLLTVPLAQILQRLHVFFDPERAKAVDKLYENGYRCWGDVLSSVIFFILAFQIQNHNLSQPLIAQGVGQLFYVGYYDFVRRRKGPGSKKKFAWSAALQALLERCRDFLPRPQPAPAQN